MDVESHDSSISLASSRSAACLTPHHAPWLRTRTPACRSIFRDGRHIELLRTPLAALASRDHACASLVHRTYACRRPPSAPILPLLPTLLLLLPRCRRPPARPRGSRLPGEVEAQLSWARGREGRRSRGSHLPGEAEAQLSWARGREGRRVTRLERWKPGGVRQRI